MDLANLKSEITADPLARNYADMTNAEVAASLNTVNRLGVVPKADLKVWFRENANASGRNCYAALSALKNGEITLDTPEHTAAATDAARVCYDGTWDVDAPPVNMSNPIVSTLLDGLILGGVIDASQKTTILALADNRQNRAEELSLGTVLEDDVKQARALA